MNLQALVAKSQVPPTIADSINDLVEAKSRTRELGNARRAPELDELIRDELSRAAEAPERQISDNDRKATNQFFLELVDT